MTCLSLSLSDTGPNRMSSKDFSTESVLGSKENMQQVCHCNKNGMYHAFDKSQNAKEGAVGKLDTCLGLGGTVLFILAISQVCEQI